MSSRANENRCSLLSESVATAKMLLLVNYRLEYRHDWGNKTYYTQLRLDPLGKEDAQEMLAVVDKNGEHYYEAELYRLKGELSLQSRQVKDKSKTSQDKSEVRSPESEVEEYFWKAIEIARRQQAKSLELRAVMSLSRLWQQQGKTAEARRMLAEIYSWFTEGFDTVDLKEAKALLDELA